MTAKQSKRNGAERPKGVGRYESGNRVSRSETRSTCEAGVGAHRTFGPSELRRWSASHDEVRIGNRDLARRARKAERNWLRSLPKGVKV